MTMQSYKLLTIYQARDYRRDFFADFLVPDRPADFDDFEELFLDAAFLPVPVLFAAFDTDFLTEAFFEDPDFLPLNLRAFSALGKSWFSSSSTWCSTFSCRTLAFASHSSFGVLARLNSLSSFLTTSCSS